MIVLWAWERRTCTGWTRGFGGCRDQTDGTGAPAPCALPTAFNRLLDLPGVSVTDVSFGEDRVIVDVALARRRLACPEAGCGFTTHARYDTRPVSSCWRHLDLGRWSLGCR